ncbi:restriction endonuclease subunit S [uncultured Prevotella sp.]|uniref:restriction endonuclease subunit S n=1 Tax=uncultured Prevotella sp. TaxID=159272 RepID=UPI00280419BB|nr:restriction endonuclease subunit S [uncultured Prevotella sp.]
MNSYYEKLLATGEVKCIDEEIPFEVPNGWEWCRVSSIFQINPKVVAEDDANAAFIPMEAISAGYGSEFRFYEKKWKEIKSGYTSFEDNDIAFAKITPCFQNRKSVVFKGLPNGIGAGTTELKILRTYGETINRFYALYFLESPYFIDEATFKGTANQQRIIVGYLENKLFPLPPLAEQNRIVNKIGMVMPVIDKYSKSQEALDKINIELYDTLKKSLLQEAIQGKLVPQIVEEGTAQEMLKQINAEKQKLVKEGKLKKSALATSAIFRGDDNKYYEKIGSKVAEIELPFDYPSSWNIVKLSYICQLTDGQKTTGKYCLLDAKYLRGKSTGNIVEQGKFVKKDDNIILVDGENSGEVFTVPQDGYMGSTFKQLWVSSSMYKPFVLSFIRFYKDFLRNSKRGAAIPHLNKELFNNLIIGIPPLKEQRRIVERIETSFQYIK